MQAVALCTRGALAIYRAREGADWQRTRAFNVHSGDTFIMIAAGVESLRAAGVSVHEVRSDALMTEYLPKSTLLEILDLPEPGQLGE